MRVTILTNYFPPEGGSGARLVGEFAGELAGQGDEVTVVCPRPSYHVSNGQEPLGVTTRRAGAPVPAFLPHRLARGVEHLVRPLWLGAQSLERPDVLYVWYPPPALLPLAATLARRWHCPMVLHVQDLFPFNAVDVGAIPGGLVSAAIERVLRPLYRRATRVVVHAPSALAYFTNLGVNCAHLPNWVKVPTTPPVSPDHCPPFHVVFAGILGLAQDLDAILGAAHQLRDHQSVRFTIAGDGAQRERVATALDERQLHNVTLQPMLMPSSYQRLVADADLLVVSLKEGIRYPVVPSKIGDALAAGRPICAAVPEGDAADVVRASGAGVVVAAGDHAGLAQSILQLSQDPDRCLKLGQAGHAFAAAQLSSDVVLPALREVLIGAASQAR